jgi:hypothetical protein
MIWVVVKHNISKFSTAYEHCYDNCESRQSLDYILQATLELYKVKQVWNQSFVYLHYWYFLKDHPRWMETPYKKSQCTPIVVLNEDEPRHQSFLSLDVADNVDIVEGEEGAHQAKPISEQLPTMTPTKWGWPIGAKSTKKEQRQWIAKEQAAKAMQWVIGDMVMANFWEAQVLEDQAALQIFMMPDLEGLSDHVHEYLDLRREEELFKLHVRVAEKKAALAREEAAKKKAKVIALRKRSARQEEIDAAKARCNLSTTPQPAAATMTPHAAPMVLQRSAPTPTLSNRSTTQPRHARQRALRVHVVPTPPISQP